MHRDDRQIRLCGSKFFTERPGHMAYGKRLCLGFALLALLASSWPFLKGAAAQSAEQSREMHETYDLAPGGVVSVNNTSGYIRVTSWGENRVKVDAVQPPPPHS